MNRCVTIDQSMLEKTKMDKILPRLLKRADDQGKILAQKILDHAANISKQKTTGGKAGQNPPTNGPVPRSPVDAKDVKRERPDDGKKVSSLTSKGSNLVKTGKSTNGPDIRQSSGKVDTKSITKTTGADTPATKIKTNQINPKPTGFFAGLKSASKKPGTSVKPEEGKTK